MPPAALITSFNLLKMAKKKKKKHIFKIDQDFSHEQDVILLGVQTKQALYKLVFDFNQAFLTGFFLNNDIIVKRKDKHISFENYVTPENNIGQKMYFLNNQVLIPVAHPNTLFDTHEAYYLFPELQTLNYLLMMPKRSDLDIYAVKQNFHPDYTLNWIEVDVTKCATAFPVFPG